MWQSVQAVTLPAGAIWCEPVSGQPVLAWLKFAFSQETVLWQLEQVAIENTVGAAECCGFVVCCQVGRWQPACPQSVAAICRLSVLPTGQSRQGTFAGPLVRGKLVGGAACWTMSRD